MAYPDLYQDEQKILEAQNVKVKSVSFNAVLTNRRLVLIDSKRQALPPQEILLATLRSIDGGENAIRDPVITLSIITTTGTTRQMILTFSKGPGGERKRECDEWVKALRHAISQTIEHPILPDIPSMDDQAIAEPSPEVPVSSPPPRIEIVNAPAQKKRIEISRPIKKIVESAPAMPAPVETTSLPTGSFCNRCGSRVPPESAFCNRCGTKVLKDSDLEALLKKPAPPAAAPQVPETPEAPASEAAPVSPSVTAEPAAPTRYIPPAAEAPLKAVPFFDDDDEPEPVVPQVAVPVSSVFSAPSEKKDRPIEEVIHSIEPLIEDSVPRKTPAPVVPRTIPLKVPEPEPEPEKPVQEPPAAAPAPAVPADDSGIRWPVISPSSPAHPVPAAGDQPAAGEPGQPAPSTAPSSAPSGRGKIIAIAVLAIVLIAAAAGVFIFTNPLASQGDNTVPTAVPTSVPVVTTTATTTPEPVTTTVPISTTTVAEVTTAAPASAPSSLVPSTGVWVRIKYPNKFTGSVGTPNGLTDVSDQGEKFYQISTSTGTVAAIITKDDGSGETLTVSVYKDGSLVTEKSTTAPKGTVEIQVSLKPATTPKPTTAITTVIPETTAAAAGNSTANATAASP